MTDLRDRMVKALTNAGYSGAGGAATGLLNTQPAQDFLERNRTPASPVDAYEAINLLPIGRVGLGTMGIRAYHGSPHSFNKFDMSKIGTGEGAQAYGHGLYFAESPKVAETYKNDIAMKQFQHGRDWTVAQDVAAKRFYENGENQAHAIASLRDRIAQGRMYGDSATSTAELNSALKLLEGGWAPPKGHMYEVNINAKPEQFLDWDRPLSQQPIAEPILARAPELRPYIENMNRANAAGLTDVSPGGTGASIYRRLADSPQGASETLREAGIPGIKYLDQGSRTLGDAPALIANLEKQAAALRQSINNGEVSGKFGLRDAQENLALMEKQIGNARASLGTGPTSNYVLFRDDIIDILRKYGMAGLAALPTMGAVMGADTKQ